MSSFNQTLAIVIGGLLTAQVLYGLYRLAMEKG